MTWVLDLVRMFLSILDRMVYGLIQVFYTAFSDIARTRVLTDTTLKEFANRIYVFLALIMLFKLAFSIITYIVNPDNFTNNEKGIGKLIQNIIITLVLIVLTPKIFDQAYNLQRIVLKENIFGRVILGTDSGGGDIMEDASVHKKMSFTVLNAFLKPNITIPELGEGDNGIPTCKANGNIFSLPTRTDTPQLDYGTDPFSTCFNGLTDQTATVNGKTVGLGEAYTYAYRNSEYQLLINLITAKYKVNKDMYLFDYTYLISTIAGGFIAWIFLIFCFDIAVRSVKLSFLQLIAPIPIISYIDPKSSKSGMFQKWTKTCLSTYADLFIRLLAIYFAVYIIKIISDSNQIFYVYGKGQPGAIITVFIIVGALMFAKQVPKLIEDITGIKLSGKFELNPLKKFEENALGGKRLTSAMSGFVTGAIGGAAAGHGIGRLGRFISGGLGGVGRGFVGGQGIRNTRDNLVSRRHAMAIARANGSNFGGRMQERFSHAFGVDTELDHLKMQEDALTRQEAEIDDRQAIGRQTISNNSKITDSINKQEERAKTKIIEGAAGAISENYFKREEQVKALQTEMENAQRSGNTADVTRLQDAIARAKTSNAKWLEDVAINDYIDGVVTGTYSDSAMQNMIESYNQLCVTYGQAVEANAAARHGQMGRLKGENGAIERTFMADDLAKEQIAEEKRALKEHQRRAQANVDAVRAQRTNK